MSESREYLIALGGNLPSRAGPPRATLAAALKALAQGGAQVVAVSRMYHSPCFPAGAGPDYVNGAARVRVAMEPAVFLAYLHDIEAEMGRERVQRWGRRTLDLDLLGEAGTGCETVLPDALTHRHWQELPLEEQARLAPEQLILPHPRLHERAFVLIPLRDIAPDWIHPVLGLSVTEMCGTLPKSDQNEVVPLC